MSKKKHDADGDLHDVVQRLITEQRATRRRLEEMRRLVQRVEKTQGLSLTAAVKFYVDSYENNLTEKFHLVEKLKAVKGMARKAENELIFTQLLDIIEWIGSLDSR